MIRYTRLFTGPDGQSHFEDIALPANNPDMGGHVSEAMKAEEVLFLERDSRGPWHIAPRRQFLIIIGGELVVEIGDGTKRRFVPGDVVLAEDTTGQGHFSDARELKSAVVPLA
jgi:hypothetical protein